jgi:hypothetical protein
MRRREQAIDDLLPGLRAEVGDERLDLFGRRRQTVTSR